MNAQRRVGFFVLLGLGLLLYLSIHIGEFRLNKNQYFVYKVYFDDTRGLDTKAPVKIAGVTVGWVEAIKLLDGGKAEIDLYINKNHKLAKNSYARISQDSFIGTKTIEIDPGDPLSGILAPQSIIPMPGKSPATVSDLLEQLRDIGVGLHDIVESVRVSVHPDEETNVAKSTMDNISATAAAAAHLAQHLDSFLNEHEKTLGLIVDSVGLATKNLPAVVENVDRAFIKADESFSQANDILKKANYGNGVVGRLINDEELSLDLKKTIKGIKSYVSKADSIMIKVDMHSENMTDKSDYKGYASLSLYTASDYFYKIGLMSGTVGKFIRTTTQTNYFDSAGNEIILPKITSVDGAHADPYTMAAFAAKTVQVVYSPSKTLIEFQVGKRFNHLTFRCGLFEDTFGVGVDLHAPFSTEDFQFITSLELFDFNGHNRPNDDSNVHCKWANKLFCMRNIYTVFGIDDFWSVKTAAPFFGVGLTFTDNDIKLLLPVLSGAIGK